MATGRLARSSTVVAAVTAATTLCQLPRLGGGLSADESATLFSARLSFGELAHQSGRVDLVLTPYYALMHLWRALVPGVIGLRLPSLLAYVAVVGVTGAWAARRWSPAAGGAAAAVVGMNPLLSSAAVEARPYALATLAVTLSLYGLDRWRSSSRPGALVLCLVAGLIAASLQAILALALIIVCPLFLVGLPRRRTRWAGVAAYGTLVVSIAAVVLASLPERAQVAWITRPSVLAGAFDLAGVALGERGLYLVILALIALAALASGYARYLRTYWRPTLSDVGPFLAWAATPGVVLLVVSLVHPIFIARYVTESAPGLGLLFGGLAARAPRALTSFATSRAVAGLGAIALAASLLFGPAPIAGNDDLAQLSAFLVAHVRVGVVALGSPTLAAAVRYYEPAGQPLRLWPLNGPARTILTPIATSRGAFSRAGPDVWIVIDRDASFQKLSALRHGLASRGYRPTTEATFPQVVVTRWVQRPGR
ncbi:MAG: hypothetical protein ACYCRG_01255 [Acidimicrobiales bacterium]